MLSANKTTKKVTCLQVTLGFVRIMLISLILSPFGSNFNSFRREELSPLSGFGFEIQLKLQSKLGKVLVLFITFLVRSIGSRSDLRCLRAEWLDRSAASPGPRADPWPNYRKKLIWVEFENFRVCPLGRKTYLLDLTEHADQIPPRQPRDVFFRPSIWVSQQLGEQIRILGNVFESLGHTSGENGATIKFKC